MAGTKHFTRMHYHVSRGLREIVAPRQTMPDKEWEKIKVRFSHTCAYCGNVANQKNRGIVADHIVPTTVFGEFVIGNVIPACQTCNDSRGDKCWREFIQTLSPPQMSYKVQMIEKYLEEFSYESPLLEKVQTTKEREKYVELIERWKKLNEEEKLLYSSKHG